MNQTSGEKLVLGTVAFAFRGKGKNQKVLARASGLDQMASVKILSSCSIWERFKLL